MTKAKDPKKVAAAKARADGMSAEKRKEIARQGAAARWRGKLYSANHTGNFLKEFGIDIECYVLDDHAKTPVISQRGMGEAIGFSRRGSRLTVFVASQTMEKFIGRDLREKIENPLIFQPPGAAAASPVSNRANGYDAAILIDLCNAILAARAAGKLSGPRYERMIEQARIITSASAKNGIRQLVYALAGYSPTTDEVIAAFKLYVQQEARKYEPEFPSELYMHWHRLYDLPIPGRGKPWQFKFLTVRHIYFPLAKSSGKILELLRALKVRDGNQKKKLFQFLNVIGARALRIHLGRILEMAEDLATRVEYENRVNNRFGGQLELDLLSIPSASPTSQSPLS